VAATIQRDRAGKPRRTFRYRDKGIMATIGRSRAVAESGRVRVSGLVAWLMWLVVHLAFLIGFRNRLFVLLEWMWSYLAFRRGARLVVARYELPAEGQPDRDPFSVQLPGFLLEGGPRSRAEQAGEEERTGEQPAAVARTPELPR
jgi:NADH dehydrogenase